MLFITMNLLKAIYASGRLDLPFETNIGDAETLLNLSRFLNNQRLRGMRRELPGAFGSAMRIPRREFSRSA
jgi:hypothetical protein